MRRAVITGLLMAVLLFLPPYFTTTAPPLADAPSPLPEKPGAAEAAPTAAADTTVILRVKLGEETAEMTMADYLPGVVRGEMPAAFEPQALAAQAAAERTYICYHLLRGRKTANPDADVCTDPACCSAWLSEEDAREKWGDKFDEYEARIEAAVAETDGQVILYDDEPILAVFHSSSDSVTAASGDVWSTDLPYLRSVSSPEDADTVPNYYSAVTVSAEEFRETFLAAHPEAVLDGDPSGWIADVTENGSGRVESAAVGGVTVPGTELRRLYGLRSASFTVSARGGGRCLPCHRLRPRRGYEPVWGQPPSVGGQDLAGDPDLVLNRRHHRPHAGVKALYN